jgi:hypothetical protein
VHISLSASELLCLRVCLCGWCISKCYVLSCSKERREGEGGRVLITIFIRDKRQRDIGLPKFGIGSSSHHLPEPRLLFCAPCLSVSLFVCCTCRPGLHTVSVQNVERTREREEQRSASKQHNKPSGLSSLTKTLP